MVSQQSTPASAQVCFAAPEDLHTQLNILITFHTPIGHCAALESSDAASSPCQLMQKMARKNFPEDLHRWLTPPLSLSESK